MFKRIFIALVCFLSICTSVYAGNGDLSVGGTFHSKNNSVIIDEHVMRLSPGTGFYLADGNVYLQAGFWGYPAGLLLWAGQNILLMPNDWMSMFLDGDSGRVGIGTETPAYDLHVEGSIAYRNLYQLSDANYKQNILPLQGSLNKVLQLRGVSYEWKPEEAKPVKSLAKKQIEGRPEKTKSKKPQEGRHVGFISQDVEKVLPEVVNLGPDGRKSVAYTEMIPVLIEAIKEQQKQIDQLKATLPQILKAGNK